MIEPKKASRCANRTGGIAWCKSLQKPCNPPQEYNHCQSYLPKQDPLAPKKELSSIEKNIPEKFLVGTKIGKCDICKTTKKILLLNYGFNLCEDCINVCTAILEYLPNDEETISSKKASADKQKSASLKQLNIA